MYLLICVQLVSLTATTLNVFVETMETKGFFQSEIAKYALVRSFYNICYRLCYESTIIINMLFLSVRGSFLYVRI